MSADQPTQNLPTGREVIQLVPEIYFDIISRIPPGMLLAVTITWSLMRIFNFDLETSRNFSAASWMVSLGISILFIVAAYVAGIALTSIRLGFWVKPLWRHAIATKGFNPVAVLNTKMKLLAPEKDQKEVRFDDLTNAQWHWLQLAVHDYLKRTDPEAKLLLPKMTAESSLCANMAASILLSVLVFLLICGRQSIEIPVQILAIASFLFFIHAAYYRQYRLIQRHLSFLINIHTSHSSSGHVSNSDQTPLTMDKKPEVEVSGQ